MATLSIPIPDKTTSPQKRSRWRRQTTGHGSMLANGEPMIWLAGGALAVCLLMIVTLIIGITINALGAFWPVALLEVKTVDGRMLLGEPTRTEVYTPSAAVLDAVPAPSKEAAQVLLAKQQGKSTRTLYRTGNYELTGEHFNWVSDFQTTGQSAPEWGMVLERLKLGRFYGTPVRFLIDGQEVANTPAASWQKFQETHAAARERWERRKSIERDEIGRVNARQEAARLAVDEAKLDYPADSPQVRAAEEKLRQTQDWAGGEFARLRKEIDALAAENQKYQLVMKTWLWKGNQPQQVESPVQVSDIVRAYPANQLGTLSKLGVYCSRWWEFVSSEPREA
ncbi:MAG: hypothetical protein K8T25_22395, partial [Planctomycetia bacterium]|nr:hypothetical protein [Planctomycetia bacterium]